MPLVSVGKFVVVGEKIKMDNVYLQQINNRIPLLKYRYRGSFTSDYVPTFDNDTFPNIDTQHSNMQCEHWMMIADSLGPKKYSFLK